MFLKLSTIKIIFFSLLLLNNNIFPKGGGSSGIFSSSKHKLLRNFDYDIELFPGQQYTGYWYFWSDDVFISANFHPTSSVNWVAMNPQSFSSSSCSDIVPTLFTFNAPIVPGHYSMSFVDFNSNWEPIDINLTVTNNPAFTSVLTVTSYVDEPIVRLDTVTIDDTGLGCLDKYLPSQTSKVSYTTFENVDWLSFTPQSFTLSTSNPKIQVTKTFLSDSAGHFSTFEINTTEWSTFPDYIKWNFNVKPKIEIITPELNETDITSEQKIIKWSGGDSTDRYKIEFSDDDGVSYKNIATVQNDIQQYSWTVPKALSSKCKIKITDTKDSTKFKESERFKIKGYELTRFTPTGDYERYRMVHDSWGFLNADGMWDSTYWKQFNYLTGVDPYTQLRYDPLFSTSLINARPQDFPDWPLYVRVFGSDNCYSRNIRDELVPKLSKLLKWAFIKGDYGGSCFGMAISSLLAFENKTGWISKFGVPDFTELFSVNPDTNIFRAINEAFVYQYSDEFISNDYSGSAKTPNETLQELKDILSNKVDGNECLNIINWVLNPFPHRFAHSVTPFKVEKDSVNPELNYIYFYDNDYIDDSYRITINTSDNTWKYIPNGWNYNLSGSDGLYLSLPANKLLQQPSTFEQSKHQSYARNYPTIESDYLQIYINPNCSVRINNSSGNFLNFSSNDSTIENTIPGTMPITPLTDIFHPPVGYTIPSNDSYRILLHSFRNQNEYLGIVTDSLVLYVGRNDAVSSQNDFVTYNGSIGIKNTEGSIKSYNLVAVLNENPTNEKSFELQHLNTIQDDSLQLIIYNHDRLKINNFGSQKNYDIILRYLSNVGLKEFNHTSALANANSSYFFEPDWNNLDQSKLVIVEDKNNDGTIDDTLLVEDNSNPPLSVALETFSASVEKEGILLNWLATTENYKNSFEIERAQLNSTSVKTGTYNNWIKIGFIKGSDSPAERRNYSFLDKNAPYGNLQYRIKQIDNTGSFIYSKEIDINNVGKLTFNLLQNYPNPFNPVTTIKYSIADAGNVTLKVYDLLGNEVATLVNERQAAGIYEYTFDGTSLSSGFYICKLSTDNYSSIKKMLLVK